VALDKYANPEGNEYDLGYDGAFEQFDILIGIFYSGLNVKQFTEETVGPALSKKGFHYEIVTTEAKFKDKLNDCDVAWIISNNAPISKTDEAEFVQACRRFHATGGGLYIWADNAPYTYHANLVLKNILGMEVEGSTPGKQVLTVGNDGSSKKHFARHLITSSIRNLFEGVTISYPKKVDPRVDVLATSSDGHPVILYAEQGPGKLSDNCGRIVLDCGYTKLWVQWDSAGTERYTVNACIWLLGLDHKMSIGAPLTRVQ
jgi:hypothetical protein